MTTVPDAEHAEHPPVRDAEHPPVRDAEHPSVLDAEYAEHPPVFVYGTLRPGQGNHARHVGGRTVSEEPAVLPGAMLYEGPGYPYALPAPGREVRGEILRPAPAQYASLLAALDELEGYRPGAGDNLYERELRTVRLRDGSTTDAWVYFAAEPLARRLRTSGTPIPGGSWPPARPDRPARKEST